jgi:hypothetical protein
MVAFATASAMALAINYAGSRFIVFRRRPGKLLKTCEKVEL